MKQIMIVRHGHGSLTADISEALAAGGVNIETLNAREAEDLDIVTLTVDRYDDALKALRDASIDAITEDAVLIRIRDEPGALAKVVKRFKDADVHVRSIRIIHRRQDWAVVAISMDRTEEAMSLIKDLMITE
ncbi:MAG: hypothetical protein KAV00_16720 [Phycisphaerae bacterium]|nr:hypothetical protein [Phycisphaerae bacterium]